MLGPFLRKLFSFGIFMLIIIYAFACILLGKRKAGQAIGSLVTGISYAGIKVAARVLKIAIMFVVNFITMIIRIAGRPDQAQNAWATFVERMSDVILGA